MPPVLARTPRADSEDPMKRQMKRSRTSTTTRASRSPAPKELDAFRRNLSQHSADAAGDDSATHAAFARALEDADKALQREYVQRPEAYAGDPWLDAYNNVQQVLVLSLHPR